MAGGGVGGLWRRLAAMPAALWRLLADWRLMAALWALLVAGLLAALLVPALRPGVPTAWEPGVSHRAWEALHPTLGWIMRALLAGAALASLVRLADGLLPLAPWRGDARPLAELAAGPEEGPALWARLQRSLATYHYRLEPWPHASREDEQGHCALAVQPWPRRALAACLPLGLLLLLVAGALLWAQGQVVTSPPLVLGEAARLPPPLALRVSLQELQLLQVPERAPWLAQAALALGSESAPQMLTLHGTGPVRYAGHWVNVAAELPAVRIVALDATGAGLELYPMVGSHPAGLVQRLAFVGQEEHLLAVPQANLLLRATAVGDVAPCCIQIQALDGRDGALRAEAFVAAPEDLAVGDITVRVTPERALLLAFWRLPGLWLAPLGLALAIVGACAARRAGPPAFALGLVHAPERDRWIVLAVVPGSAGVAQRLRSLLAESIP